MHYTFIDIGCGSFGTSVDVYGTNVNGILVEPVKECCDVLPRSQTVFIEQSAISSFDGEQQINVVLPVMPLTYIPITVLKNKKHRDRISKKHGVSGMSSLLYDLTYYAKPRDQLTQTWRTVNVITLQTLFEKYNVTSVDHIKIDVEGFEHVILEQLIQLLQDQSVVVNKSIRFEYNHLGNKPLLDRMKHTIETEFNFSSEFIADHLWNEDIVMFKR
jgi:FkbM family methyltransferase